MKWLYSGVYSNNLFLCERTPDISSVKSLVRLSFI